MIFVLVSFLFVFGCQTENTTTPTTIPASTTQTSTIMDTTIVTPVATSATQTIDYRAFEQPYGYAALGITDRSDAQTGYYQVETVLELLDAMLASDAQVIEINSDLDLGSVSVLTEVLLAGKTLDDYRSVYRPASRQALLHPILKETGVGVVRIIGKDGLTIFSPNGSKIKHATINIDDSNDIVIRNLHLTELWEWDEIDNLSYKRNDWDYILIEKSQNIWLDHLKFDQAYDGIIDVKENSANITLSWSELVFEVNDFIRVQIAYLEANREENPYYDSLRTAGIEVADIELLASFQKKGFNFGNTTDGEGFESITVTFHHLKVENLQDRFPRIRKGDVHLYAVSLDNHDLFAFSIRVNDPLISLVNQGIVTTEQGSVLMENSRFAYVQIPIKNHQDSNPDISYTGKYKVIDSELVTVSRTYFGSSEGNLVYWNHIGSPTKLEFSLRNHESIPYLYQLEDIYYLEETFASSSPGCQILEGFDWTFVYNDE
jgi:pectate lyase